MAEQFGNVLHVLNIFCNSFLLGLMMNALFGLIQSWMWLLDQMVQENLVLFVQFAWV